MYLIANYKYRDFESNNYLDQVQRESVSIKKIIEDKKQYLEFIRTNAYQDLISKANQNKKHSFE
jgi:hypothetical protein